MEKTNINNLDILFEDNHLIIINKRAGDLVQGDKTGDACLAAIIKDFLKKRDKKAGNVYLGVVHRLDRPTSGVVIFSKTSKALPRLNKMLQDRELKKTYWAFVKKTPANLKGSLVHYLQRNTKQNKSYAFDEEKSDRKKGILHYETKLKLTNYTLLEVVLETGRHHQIRSQLSKIGSPIKGDLKYGFDRSNPDGSIHLHARKIQFQHPVKDELVSVEAQVPLHDPLWKEAAKTCLTS